MYVQNVSLVWIVVCLGGVLTVWAWIRLGSRVRGTTLEDVRIWQAVAGLAAMAAAIVHARHAAEDHAEIVRFFAAGALFCPNMALLGAKRPQHRAWHLVVATLWLIIALPACEAAWLGDGRSWQTGAVRGGFLWVLVALELLNRVGTGAELAGIAMAVAEVLLLGTFLPGWGGAHDGWGPPVALLAVAVQQWECWRTARMPSAPVNLNSAWRAFKRRFGFLWALRVWVRINAACQTENWPVVLGWSGFCDERGAPVDPARVLAPQQYQALCQTFVNLVRRFESAELVEQLRRGASTAD